MGGRRISGPNLSFDTSLWRFGAILFYIEDPFILTHSNFSSQLLKKKERVQLLHHRFKVFPINQPVFPICEMVCLGPNCFYELTLAGQGRGTDFLTTLRTQNSLPQLAPPSNKWQLPTNSCSSHRHSTSTRSSFRVRHIMDTISSSCSLFPLFLLTFWGL